MRRCIAGLSAIPNSIVAIVLFLVAGLFLSLPELPQSWGADRAAIRAAKTLAIGATPRKSVTLDPDKVMTALACTNCHKLEFAAWKRTKHFGSIEAKLNPAAANVRKYCRALGIDLANVQKNSLCVTCHATPQADAAGKVRAVSGVSCESCHGAAGGEAGWLNRHAVYGPDMAKASEETAEHRKARLEFCRKSGMMRSVQIYEIAKTCLGCHLVGNEKLVKAGHPGGSTGFDLTAWSAGEVRHNFHSEVQRIDTRNAEAPQLWARRTHGTAERRKRVTYVLGTLADLELSLRHRAKAKSPTFIAQLGGRVGGLNGKLAQITGVAPSVTEISPLQARIGAAFGRLFTPMPDDQKYYTEFANTVSDAAMKFLQSHDGSKLGGLDSIIKATLAKGMVFQP